MKSFQLIHGRVGRALAVVLTLVACSTPTPRYYVAAGATSASAFVIDGRGIAGTYLFSFLEPTPSGPAVKNEEFETSLDGTVINLRDTSGDACAPWTFKQMSDQSLTVSNGVETTRYVSAPKSAYEEATQSLLATARTMKGLPGGIIDDWKPSCKFYSIIQTALASAEQSKFDSIRGTQKSTNGHGHFIYSLKGVRSQPSAYNCYLLLDPNAKELYCRLKNQAARDPWAAEFTQEISRSLPASYKMQICQHGDAVPESGYCKSWKGNGSSGPSVILLGLPADSGSYAFMLLVRLTV